jgi:hypothetical protein
MGFHANLQVAASVIDAAMAVVILLPHHHTSLLELLQTHCEYLQAHPTHQAVMINMGDASWT